MATKVTVHCQAVGLLRLIDEAENRCDWELAVDLYLKLQLLLPNDHRVATNAGHLLWRLDRPTKAYEHYLLATNLAPHQSIPWRGIGNTLRDLNDFEAADNAYQRSWQLSPEPITAWNHSQLLIGLEDYNRAYSLAEYRFQLTEFSTYRNLNDTAIDPAIFTTAPWLHIWSEQGLGDTLQYLRWCLALAKFPGNFILELEPSLVNLAREGFAWLKNPPKVEAKNDSAAPCLASCAQHTSLMSLPHLLGGAPLAERFKPAKRPGHWHGYLRSKAWPLRIPGQRPRVGLVWAAGNKIDDPFTAREYRKRSLPSKVLEHLIGGLLVQQAEIISMQIGSDHRQIEPWHNSITDFLPQQADFSTTARWIRELDLLISVDTAAAHLAGALGHPCWLLLPFSADPRWLRQRQDSPWYPSMRLFRQPETGQWSQVIKEVLSNFSPWWHSVSS